MAMSFLTKLRRIPRCRLSSLALLITLSPILLFLAEKLVHSIQRQVLHLLHGPRMVDMATFNYTVSQMRMSDVEERDTYALLHQFHRLMTRYGIEYAGFGGTVLGASRHAGLIPWDDDADFVVMKRDKPRLLRVIATQEVLKLCYMNDDFYKIAFRNRSLSKNSNRYCPWPNLDIFLGHDMGSKLDVVFQGDYIFPKSSYFPAVLVPFGPIYLYFPRCFHQIALQSFDYFEVCCTGAWNHRTESWAPRPACVPCKQLQDRFAFANFTKLTNFSSRMVLRTNQKVIREEIVAMPMCHRVSIQFIEPEYKKPVTNF